MNKYSTLCVTDVQDHLTLCILSWQPGEDVTYASIDHSSVRRSGRARASADDECDYATVQVPAALQPESEASSKDEREDDYVLMS